jgi:hypothetical protein
MVRCVASPAAVPTAELHAHLAPCSTGTSSREALQPARTQHARHVPLHGPAALRARRAASHARVRDASSALVQRLYSAACTALPRRFHGDHNSMRPKFFYDSIGIFFLNSLRLTTMLTVDPGDTKAEMLVLAKAAGRCALRAPTRDAGSRRADTAPCCCRPQDPSARPGCPPPAGRPRPRGAHRRVSALLPRLPTSCPAAYVRPLVRTCCSCFAAPACLVVAPGVWACGLGAGECRCHRSAVLCCAVPCRAVLCCACAVCRAGTSVAGLTAFLCLQGWPSSSAPGRAAQQRSGPGRAALRCR